MPLLGHQQPGPGERAAEGRAVGDARVLADTRWGDPPSGSDAVPRGSGAGNRHGNWKAIGQSSTAVRPRRQHVDQRGEPGDPGHGHRGRRRRAGRRGLDGDPDRGRARRGRLPARRAPGSRRPPRPGRARRSGAGPRTCPASSPNSTNSWSATRSGPETVTTTGSPIPRPRCAGSRANQPVCRRSATAIPGSGRPPMSTVRTGATGSASGPGRASSSPAPGRSSTDSSGCSPHGCPRRVATMSAAGV